MVMMMKNVKTISTKRLSTYLYMGTYPSIMRITGAAASGKQPPFDSYFFRLSQAQPAVLLTNPNISR